MPPDLIEIVRVILSGVVLAIGLSAGFILLSLAYKLQRNSDIKFRADDYRTGMTYDRKKNRIVFSRRLTDKAVNRVLQTPAQRDKPCR